MSIKPETNPEFDAETERGMRTPPMPTMPDFKPFVSAEQLEELSGMSKEGRAMVIPILKALSVSDQRTAFIYHEGVVTRGGIREIERKALDWKTVGFKAFVWLLGSWIGALILAHYHLA